jgi:hypothetical protein
VIDRVERSDVLNACALAAVILFMGYLVMVGVGYFTSAIDDGLWSSSGGDVEIVDLSSNPLVRPPNEVSIRVGNGSDGRQGLAGRATRRLESTGYGTLEPKNKDGDPIDESFVYYIDGYKADALQIAEVLKIAETQVRPLLDDPGVTTEGADVVVILGQDADF